jgi:hypothetical protein
MDGELAALAGSAATTIVTLLATDTWGEVKEKIGGFWRRFRPEQADAAEQELDRSRREIATADYKVAPDIIREWESRLLPLLAADSAAAPELVRVLADLSQSRVGLRIGAVRQTAKASGLSTIIQVGGDATLGEFSLIPNPLGGRGERHEAGRPGLRPARYRRRRFHGRAGGRGPLRLGGGPVGIVGCGRDGAG